MNMVQESCIKVPLSSDIIERLDLVSSDNENKKYSEYSWCHSVCEEAEKRFKVLLDENYEWSDFYRLGFFVFIEGVENPLGIIKANVEKTFLSMVSLYDDKHKTRILLKGGVYTIGNNATPFNLRRYDEFDPLRERRLMDPSGIYWGRVVFPRLELFYRRKLNLNPCEMGSFEEELANWQTNSKDITEEIKGYHPYMFTSTSQHQGHE